jgi:murein DD-endopeptidase MepM/ murein hydrolase activator NlpD
MHRKTLRSRLSNLTSAGALVGAAALIVSTSLPANAFYERGTRAQAAENRAVSMLQSFRPEATIKIAVTARDGYGVTLPPPPPPKIVPPKIVPAGVGGGGGSVNPTGAVRWPFPTQVPVSSGFGPRRAPCAGCSSFHDGTDFTPGAGATIHAIAAGIVSAVIADSGGYGTHVIISHSINGQKVQSTYAHMIAGSPMVAVGQAVAVGQPLGLVGSTGASTGAHLHLGITVNGSFVDPFAWLKANAH